MARAGRPAVDTLVAAAFYTAVTLAVFWPALPAIATQVIGDLGDPLLVMWALSWVSAHMTSVLGGDIDAFGRMWNANIFFPETNTLAYSDHFASQAVLGLPLWWATDNLLLVYNLSVLATFVLTALGTCLLTRALTGGLAAPLAAGVFAAFNVYRLGPELMHLQVLSIQWFPFALLAIHRYIASGSWRALAGIVVATLALNLSSGYYMLYCAPFVALFAIVDLAAQGRAADRGRWGGLATAAVVIALLTMPFVLPYLRMQGQLGFTRPIAEVLAYSATAEQYRTFVLPWAQVPLALTAPAVAALWTARPPARRLYVGFFLACALAAFSLSMGPVIQPWGVRGPYWWLYQYVPGFTGLRVANRYGALVLVLVPVLAGVGAAWLVRWRRVGPGLLIAATTVFLWQVWPTAIPLNVPLPSVDLNPPPAYLSPSATLPTIYREVQTLPSDAVLLELPFGDPWYDLRYVFFAATHHRRIANGYSGLFPPSYLARQAVLRRPLLDPERATLALGGVTHVIVHRAAWPDGTGTAVAQWLERVGGTLLTSSGDALLYQVATTERLASALPPGR